jgi:Na+-transporting methylmalonyl-CoA/oxaloacetate decarboxylase gamma subunit
MSDRGFLFLFSIFMIVAGIGATVWLFATGQALTVDGLFLVLTALLTALVFALYVMFVIHRAMEAAAKPAAAPAKAAPASPAKPAAPAPVAQQ